MAKVLIFISFFFLSLTSLVSSIEVNSANYEELVMKSKDKWMIQFGIPWCGAVKALVPEWEKASKSLEGKVKLGEVNCDKNHDLSEKFKIASFPTIIAFSGDKTKQPFLYQGQRTAAAIEETALADWSQYEAKS
ncbi:hypothetical protein LXL04_017595 [Taraxacum kok-saghyz]